MDSEPTITLHCVRKNGSHERTKLSLRSVSEAREVAKRLLRLGNGLYTEVDICTEDGTISGWSSQVDPKNAVIKVTTPNAVYKGLTIGQTGGHAVSLCIVALGVVSVAA